MSTSSIRRNTVFSSINMIFFNYTGKAVFKCISSGRRSSLLFWQKGNIIFVEKRNTVFTEYTENVGFPCKTVRPSFISLLNNKIIFLGKRNTIIPDNARKIILECSVLKIQSFQYIWKKEKNGVSCIA